MRLVAATAHGGQRSADASPDLDRAAKRVPSATKVSPAAIEVITTIRNHALAALQRSRGRVVAALVEPDPARRSNASAMRRLHHASAASKTFEKHCRTRLMVSYGSESAQIDRLAHPGVSAGTANEVTFRPSHGQAKSPRTPREASLPKNRRLSRTTASSCELDGPHLRKKKDQLQQENLRERPRRYEKRTLAGARCQPLCVEAVRAALRNKTFAFVSRRRGAHASREAAKRRRQDARAP